MPLFILFSLSNPGRVGFPTGGVWNAEISGKTIFECLKNFPVKRF
ncbi:hypothetical protein CLOSTHATH_01192 [Hungatella hathewayi DSM 13479]|uniref:Uncharacterized protein n=1 Tax=Hungatella hathewayi DSM 13479 TaxID=566550 RepID=D3AC64_9FIRM|nr:hypothetical protein CLOSTHATH_01192 [Hungatella hathewayi DSM 13479]